MRNCLHATTTVLFEMPVRCAGPSTCPQTIRERSTSRRVKPANGVAEAVGTDMSTTQLVRWESVPCVTAWDADDGRMMCWSVWPEILMFEDWEKEGLRMALLSEGSKAGEEESCSSTASVAGDRRPVAGVGANEDAVVEESDGYSGPRRRRCAASSAASLIDTADAFFFLKENFCLGAMQDFASCSSSVSAFTA